MVSGIKSMMWLLPIALAVTLFVASFIGTVYAKLGDTQMANGVINTAPRLEACGDQNYDRVIDVQDAIIDMQITVGLLISTEEHLILSDVARDGVINVFDVIMTLQHIVGLEEITGGGGPIQPPLGMVSWWPGDGHANDIVDGNHGTLEGGATFATGKVEQAFSLDGIDDFVDLGNAPNLQVSAGDFTIEAWCSSATHEARTLVVLPQVICPSWIKCLRAGLTPTGGGC